MLLIPCGHPRTTRADPLDLGKRRITGQFAYPARLSHFAPPVPSICVVVRILSQRGIKDFDLFIKNPVKKCPMSKTKNQYWAVAGGKSTGIFTSWE
jgi:hypothetical protein